MKVALYSRVSTGHQNVQQQLDMLKKYAKSQEWEIIHVVKDQESGKIPLLERKKFKALLDNLEPYDAVLVYKLDRLTRNWADEPALERAFSNGCTLFSMDGAIDLKSADGRVMFRMRMAMACWEPELMRERQKVGIARARADGKFKGGKKGRTWAK